MKKLVSLILAVAVLLSVATFASAEGVKEIDVMVQATSPPS